MEQTIRAIIIDDEQLAIDTLRWQLEEFCSGVELVESFTNPKDAIEFLKNQKVDLCFLDINMPEFSGFDFLEKWNNRPPFKVIFTTAYSEYAIKAFKVSALDYLLKPIDEEDLLNTMKRFRENLHNAVNSDQMALLMSQIYRPNSFASRIALPTLEGVNMVNVNDIIRLQADSNYTLVYFTNQPHIMVSKTLKEVEKVLDENTFVRIHKSHTVNISRVKMYKRGSGGSLVMTDQSILPVSKTRKNALLNKLGI